MSGKRDKKRRREEIGKIAEMHSELNQMTGGEFSIGMSVDESAGLARQAAIQIRTELTRLGAIDKMPWGVVAQPASLLAALKDCGDQVEAALDALDAVDEQASGDVHFQVLMQLCQTLMGTAGAAILMLQSMPLPYGMVKHFIVKESPKGN